MISNIKSSLPCTLLMKEIQVNHKSQERTTSIYTALQGYASKIVRTSTKTYTY